MIVRERSASSVSDKGTSECPSRPMEQALHRRRTIKRHKMANTATATEYRSVAAATAIADQQLYSLLLL